MTPLDLAPEEFRRLAQRVVDLATQFLETLDSRPTFPNTSGSTVEQIFDQSIPEKGLGEQALAGLGDVLNTSRPPSPRFYGYVLGSGDPVAAIADLLASVLNQNVTAWRSGPAAVTIERTVVGGLADAIGCRGFSGSLTSGGSAANLMGLAMARESKAPANERGVHGGAVYSSEEVHMSIPKSVGLLGIGRANLRLISCDEAFRMNTDELDRAIQDDLRAGKTPIAVVASAGTVNTGTVDPLRSIAEIAHRHGAWFHVDGAYGALAALAVPEKFAGLEKADSLSLDPHKWLYQPLDCGCLLFRDPAAAQRAFSHSGDYARALSSDPVEGFAFFEESIELSRRFRALKLWFSLRYHGLGSFREAIRRDLDHAKRLADLVRKQPSLELLAPVELSAVCFRARQVPGKSSAAANLNRWNAAILQRVIQRGRVYISNASIHGNFALRACFVNHRTSDADVDAIVDEVLTAAKDVGDS